ncbi:MAG: hypothetical protein JST82_02570 [Bacteroidetes bacterium]|nr:hypothetical protein [Bacteroidota bacterium]
MAGKKNTNGETVIYICYHNFYRVIKRILYIVIAGVLFGQSASAQRSDYSGVNAAIGASALVYLGDLTPKQFGDLNYASPGVQASIMVPVTKVLGARFYGNAGSLNGDDKRYDGWRKRRSFSFSSNVVELGVMAQFELSGQRWEWPEEDRYRSNFNRKKYKAVSPYIMVGIGYLHNSVKRDMTGIDSNFFEGDIAWVNYYKEQNTFYKMDMMVVPLGAGVHILMGPSVRLYAEYCYHMVFNDNLDGFGVAVASSKADAYQSFTLGLDFRFLRYNAERKKEKCYLGL